MLLLSIMLLTIFYPFDMRVVYTNIDNLIFKYQFSVFYLFYYLIAESMTLDKVQINIEKH